ncbi:Rrf2 family transcriptional regulator [Sinanaerobacter sp. ZZT-01]|uniref:RrF2 family transcriptional regulator n=1 Tax=Sinanaerobacter sp. ZZT-01 TaxID=3111540 RepID=UPI002D78408E|nr:Rrf2 family transcriptional regulator [Sinanaerobacter sp. ZZT-01]WRR94497.1 Rrf2 family transcriptional regulator [Sinanaerobacter sp. ZZT-01]
MRISAKSRYALAALTYMALIHANNETVTLIKISETLGISKLYLEQAFSLLRQAELVTSIKGPQGGYRLNRDPKEITVYQIFSAIEASLFRPTEQTVHEKAPFVDKAMQARVFSQLDKTILDTLSHITLADLVEEESLQNEEASYMFFI